jgi:uncharacterized SAM-binding protein YcdF (DUF218 family)
MTNQEIDKLAEIVWDYHHLNQPLKKAGCLLVLCSHDTRVAEYAAELFLQNYAPYIIFSGGLGRLTEGIFNKPEAEIFSEIAIKKGVPRDKIIIENGSTNTGENIIFTKKLLAHLELNFSSFIVIQKPYMERRAYATFKKLWPEKELIVSSPPIPFKKYPTESITEENLINIMVGDLQRIKIYPEKGFQIFQEIPDDVWEAHEKLVEFGFNKQLIK